MTSIDLDNPEFRQAYRLLEATRANVFLTGKAGTGKSTFLKYICDNLYKKKVVLAPTGVAAVNVGGVTIHSFFQMPLRPVPPDDPDYSVKALADSSKFSRQKRKLIRELELIIIDEVSMVRPDMIDFIDRALRGIRGQRGVPFGGVQLLLVGDIFQLEPVVTNDSKPILSRYYPSFFFFNAKAYAHANLCSIELKKIYRQSDSSFIGMLDRIRNNTVTSADIEILNSRCHFNVSNPDCEPREMKSEPNFEITLTARRDTAESINASMMEQLPEEPSILFGSIENDFPEKLLPTDLCLTLKKDAQVMLIRNDNKGRRWVNGTIARVTEIGKNHISIILEDGNEYKVERETWENINYYYDEKERKVKEEILGKFTQFPVKAAWALTIHKSQGLTFNHVTIDMAGGAFSAGQTYVALSRCRSLEGLRFVNPLRRYDVIVSRSAAEFSVSFNDEKKARQALRDAEVALLSSQAIHAFKAGNMSAATNLIHEADIAGSILSSPAVRRLIARYLGKINILAKELECKTAVMTQAAVKLAGIADKLDGTEISATVLRHDILTESLKLDPECPQAIIVKANHLVNEGKIKESIAMLKPIIKKKDKALAYRAAILSGDANRKLGDFSAAALNYMSALKKSPSENEPAERLASLYEEAGMHDEADTWRDV